MMEGYPPCREMPLFDNKEYGKLCERPGNACEECTELYEQQTTEQTGKICEQCNRKPATLYLRDMIGQTSFYYCEDCWHKLID